MCRDMQVGSLYAGIMAVRLWKACWWCGYVSQAMCQIDTFVIALLALACHWDISAAADLPFLQCIAFRVCSST
jgi:hypothetical protein